MVNRAAIPNIIATICASAAFILGCFSLPWCDFASLPISVVDSAGTVLLETNLGVGLWRHQTSYWIADHKSLYRLRYKFS